MARLVDTRASDEGCSPTRALLNCHTWAGSGPSLRLSQASAMRRKAAFQFAALVGETAQEWTGIRAVGLARQLQSPLPPRERQRLQPVEASPTVNRGPKPEQSELINAEPSRRTSKKSRFLNLSRCCGHEEHQLPYVEFCLLPRLICLRKF